MQENETKAPLLEMQWVSGCDLKHPYINLSLYIML